MTKTILAYVLIFGLTFNVAHAGRVQIVGGRTAIVGGSTMVNASVQFYLNQIPARAATFFVENGNSYGTEATTTEITGGTSCPETPTAGTMWADPVIRILVSKAISVAGDSSSTIMGVNAKSACGSGTTYWAFAVTLQTHTTLLWCVDSAGRAKLIQINSINAINETLRGCL